jgi:hypothetical protein
MLGCYILCNEILVEVDQLTIEVEGIDSKTKVEVVRPVNSNSNISTTSQMSRSFNRVKPKLNISTTS